MSVDEITSFHKLSLVNSSILSTAGQRRYGENFTEMQQWLPFIGTIHNLDAVR